MVSFKKILKKILPASIVAFGYYVKRCRIVIFRWGTPRYHEDALVTAHYPTFMEDDKFIACYNSAVKETSDDPDIRWRAHVIIWAANRGKNLEGDFVECGVNKGFFSKVAMDYIGFKELHKTFFLLDTYEGLIEKYFTENEKKAGKGGGGYEPCYGKVLNTFKNYKNVKIIKGAVPETLPQVTSKKIAYLSIDMNCVIPEIAFGIN